MDEMEESTYALPVKDLGKGGESLLLVSTENWRQTVLSFGT